ncbi:MAG TPA: hypothetical protein DCW68_01230 [Rhodospirillaceae bacterium]|nr:MAG: hypothetical protein A2018_04195 [Alphaproteobacteria bacterium GWF2_58_20]HAU28721.1 hypothetical protein [Rhodospirillaceae bacterium]
MPFSSGQLPPQGTSRAATDIRQLILRLAGSDLPVMIFGETGTGKELIAKALHENGKWCSGTFVTMPLETRPQGETDLAAIWQEKLHNARGGTLYVDDVAELPMPLQLSLLTHFVDGQEQSFRLITSTRRDMAARVRRGVFREDLLVRINVAAIRIPPLRRRTEDIPLLFEAFAERCVAEGDIAKTLDESAASALLKHSWPGNVRELKNLARTITVLCPHSIISQEDVESALRHSAAPTDIEERGIGASVERQLRRYFAAHSGSLPMPGLYDRIIHEVEKPLITLALEATGGNQIKSAELLGVNRNTLRRKMLDLGLAIETRRGRKS